MVLRCGSYFLNTIHTFTQRAIPINCKIDTHINLKNKNKFVGFVSYYIAYKINP